LIVETAAPYGWVRRQILRLAGEKLKAVEIAQRLDCNESYVRRVLRMERPPRRHGNFAKPTMGYPTRRDAIIAMHADGKTQKEISTALRVTKGYVSGVLSEAGRTRRTLHSYVTIPADTLAMIQDDADRRGVHVKELAARLLTKTAQDGLVDAIMDDAA
jgi:hypothetical protein